MSATTTLPQSLNIPKPAIAAASTVSDVVNVMANDPQVRGAILSAFQGLLTGDKALWQSKTFWAAIIVPIVATLAAHSGLGLDNATVGAVDTILEGLAMVAMRLVTKTAVTGIVNPASAT